MEQTTKDKELKLSILSRADLCTDKEIPELQNIMESSIVEVSDYLADKTEDSLMALEESLMDDFTVNEEYLKNVKYTLPGNISIEGTDFTSNECILAILDFLHNNMEVEFRATLGLYQTIKFWQDKSEVSDVKASVDVPYYVFDGTLRMIGTLKFKGYECLCVLAINEWFTQAHNTYIRDNAYTNYLAAVHQAILERLEHIKAPADEVGNAEIEESI